MRILGLDPGLRNTGWGVIDAHGNLVKHVENGVCRSAGESLSERLVSLFRQLSEIVESTEPDVAAVEKTFVAKGAVSTLALGQARAVSLLVPGLAGLAVFEYAPNAVKKAVVGVGHAEKKQVEQMVRFQLPSAEIGGSDAADALAVALTHAFSRRLSDLAEITSQSPGYQT